MDFPQYKILAADLSIHALVIIDGPSCRVLDQRPYPEALCPLTISVQGNKAFIPANDTANNKGALFVLNLASCSFYQLPAAIPAMQQFTLHPDGTQAYLISTDNTLYLFDIASLSLTACGSLGREARVTGLAATQSKLYSIWENSQGGALLSFNRQGELLSESTFAAIPTSITAVSEETILITFTSDSQSGEGVLLVTDQPDTLDTPDIIITLCPDDMRGHQNYPIHAVLSPDGSSAYIVNEDSASISVLDLRAKTITGHILVGRSVSKLYILPDSRFALASSSLFADLVLIDLVNAKVLATTTSQHELYPELVLLSS